jgi:predicted RNA binding protein YcfA (HicA-like mRNA interferase family)
MSPRLPRVTTGELLRALRRGGWRDVRQSGSHLILEHPARPGYVTVAVHSGTVLLPKTMGRILDQAGLTADELRDML